MKKTIVQKLNNIVYLNDDGTEKEVKEYNKFIIDVTNYTENENYRGSQDYLFILLNNGYDLDMQLLQVKKSNVKIEKDLEIISSNIPTHYEGLLSLFLATERFNKEVGITYDERDIFNHFKRVKSVFKLDIDKINNAMKPYPYKLTISYQWRKYEKKIMEVNFSLKNNYKDSMLLEIASYQVKHLIPIEEWYQFIGMKKSVFELDKQFFYYDGKHYLNLPFSKKIQEPYSIYLKNYYKDKYVPVSSNHRSNVILTYDLEFN